MSKILTFKGKGAPLADSAFLQDDSDALDFRTDGSGEFDLEQAVFPFNQGEPDRTVNDWTNQELADLFRVRRLLNTAGVVCSLEHGLTDDGDPWSVLLDSQGEVFIHFCRIDGHYLLDSPNLERPLQGADFSGLVSDFSNRAIPRTPTENSKAADGRIVHFKRNGKVRLHPSALLSALIWTLFLESEELILVTSQAHVNDDSDIGAHQRDARLPQMDENSNSALPGHQGVPTAPLEIALLEQNDDMYHKMAGTEANLADANIKDVNAQQGLVTLSNVYAIGLSAIAVASGLMTKSIWQEELKDASGKPDEPHVSNPVSEDINIEAVENQAESIQAVVGSFFEALFSQHMSEDLAILRETVLATFDIGKNVAASGDISEKINSFSPLVLPEINTNSTIELSLAQDAALENPERTTEYSISQEDVRNKSETNTQEVSTDGTVVSLLSQFINFGPEDISSILTAWQPTSQDAPISNSQVFTSFSITDHNEHVFDIIFSHNQNSSKVIEENENENLLPFDDKAQFFIESLVARGGDVEVVYYEGTLIVVDFAALVRGAPEHMELSWELDDGSIVSTIGFRSDFEAFDLIA